MHMFEIRLKLRIIDLFLKKAPIQFQGYRNFLGPGAEIFTETELKRRKQFKYRLPVPVLLDFDKHKGITFPPSKIGIHSLVKWRLKPGLR